MDRSLLADHHGRVRRGSVTPLTGLIHCEQATSCYIETKELLWWFPNLKKRDSKVVLGMILFREIVSPFPVNIPRIGISKGTDPLAGSNLIPIRISMGRDEEEITKQK